MFKMTKPTQIVTITHVPQGRLLTFCSLVCLLGAFVGMRVLRTLVRIFYASQIPAASLMLPREPFNLVNRSRVVGLSAVFQLFCFVLPL